ncbi:Major facilitator superfamily domain, general substrate transporter [Cordyceps fumosorosea ARSEF 2679]|uniref:Major facilitator superfamily domain, general substrate transporter n=1 Tax=Cordyceps fumosorosea (strain ARSEF 2679) TaxID=1081104 RepID=A0A168DFJ2_CORFA|nr:Major facilitator superfamily domain, general substrate transporter [Cordyceps fumosorosea ARSEF 2679]OAA72550.1 Major facilitator superfamily domain, general substrate transporter [Cordyceps fumosorosea ARSEF 2679]
MPSSEHERDGNALEAAPPLPAATEEPFTIFDKRQKWFIVFLVSVAATCTSPSPKCSLPQVLPPLASNIYFPALPAVAADLDVSMELATLTVTSYLVLQGLAPSLWGPVSDVRGRRVAYLGTFLVFLGACVGLGLTRNYATLVALRCLQSAGSASTIAVGAGVVGDVTTRAERGGFMGVFQAGLLTPVAVGPVVGGAIAGALGWRAVFWFLAAYSGAFLLALAAALPETLRSLVGNGSVVLEGNWLARYPLGVYQRTTRVRWDRSAPPAALPPPRRIDVLGPLRILGSRCATPIIVFLAVYYTVWQMSITAMSSLFKERYGLSEMQIGLTFIANGVGCVVGTLVTGRILDADYRRFKTRLAAAWGGTDGDEASFPIEMARLRLIPVFSILQCLSLLLFGWTVQYPRSVPIAIPIMSTFVTGWTAISTQSIITTYLVDVFPDRSAAATASLNLARCLFAAGGTSFIMPMISGLGVGWTFTVCVAVQLVALIGPLVQYRYAGKWRMEMEKEAENSSKV